MSRITDDDLDRLADYTAGLLDPVQAAEVDRLIATDAGWARTHAALVAAEPLVDRALAGLPAEPVPTDVADRLDRALKRAGTGTRSNVIDLGRARRWRRAALATAAVAAAVAACVGGLATLNGRTGFNSSTSSTAARDGDKAAAPGAAQGFAEALPTRASGMDYTHDTLGGPLAAARSGQAANAATVPDATGGPGAEGAQHSTAVPAELVRLTDPVQLRNCLDAIVAVQGGQATAVDYARYRGAPALIVVLVGGRVAAVAAGPACGQPGIGPAIIDTAP